MGGGRNATINGPTIDFQSFFSGRGVSTNFIGYAGDTPFDDDPFIASSGLQFDTPAGYAGQAPFPGAVPTPATGWSGPFPRPSAPPGKCACACSTAARCFRSATGR